MSLVFNTQFTKYFKEFLKYPLYDHPAQPSNQLGYCLVEGETSALWNMLLVVYSQPSAGKPCHRAGWRSEGIVSVSLSSVSAPALLHNKLDFFSQDVPPCPSVSSGVDWQPLWTVGTEELTAMSFSSATMRFTQAHLQGFRPHFNSRDPCIWLWDADVGCPHLLVTDCEKYLQSQLLLLFTHGNRANCLALVFCLDLSRLNRAAWDSKDKTQPLFEFHCGREMFSHRFKSWSSQKLQALSRRLSQKGPEAHCPSHHCANQSTKNLLSSPQQFQP